MTAAFVQTMVFCFTMVGLCFCLTVAILGTIVVFRFVERRLPLWLSDGGLTKKEKAVLRKVVIARWLGERDGANACFEVMQIIDPAMYELFCKDRQAAVKLVDPKMDDDE